MSPACLCTARSAATVPLCPGLVPKMSAATPKRPREGDLGEGKLWAPALGCHGRRTSPVTAATRVRAAPSVTHLPTHSACSSESDTANYVQSSSAKGSLLLFFFLFAIPQSQKHSAHPRRQLLLALLPLTQLTKAAVPRVPQPRPPRAAAPSPEPCRAAGGRQGSHSSPRAGAESGLPRVRRGPGESLTPPCDPPTEDHANCRASPA